MSDLIPSNGRPPLPAPGPVQNGYGRAAWEEEETVDLRELLAVLRRQAWLVLAVTAAVFGIAAFMVLRQVPQYQATAVLRLLDERRVLTGGVAGVAQDMIGQVDPLLSQMQVLRSRGVAADVVERTGLRLRSETPVFSAGSLQEVRVAETWTADTLSLRFEADGVVVRGTEGETRGGYGEPILLSGVQFTVPARRPSQVTEATVVVVPQAHAIERFSAGLRGNVRERTNVFDISYTDPDPALAQRVVNTTVQVFQQASARSAQQQATRRRIFLEEQLAQTDSTLTLAQLALTDFQQREGVASSQEKLAAQQVGLMELDVRREELESDRRVLRSFLAALSDEDQGGGRLGALISNPGVVQNPVVSSLFNQLVRLEISRDSLTVGEWGSAQGNPDVQRLNLLIGSTRARLIEAVESHASTLDARVAALDDLRARNLVELQALPMSGAEEVRLVQQVQGVGKVADQLREEYQRARIAEAVEVGQVEILDLATLPNVPVGSGRLLKLTLGLILGLMLGSGGAFLREHLNTAVRRKEDLEVLHVASLGVIPSFAPRSGGARRVSFPLIGNGNGHRKGESGELVTVGHLHSSGSEAYRTLRTNLIFSQALQSLRTLVVTSSTPAEGKTTTAANLAVAFAQQGMRILLVDCDLRKARLHNVFGVPREPGLTQVVLGHAEAKATIRSTEVSGLHILTAGTLPPNPAELLGGEGMSELIAKLSVEYDLIVFDTPPLLAASDAAILGRLADGVLLVVRAGHTDRGAAAQALHQLRVVGARVLGAVLNDPDEKVPSYGGYYQYDYYGSEAAGRQ